jgi:hypothetical protein
VFRPRNKLTHRGGGGAQPARREEGAYPLPIFNRRATPQDGMHRFPNADVFLGRDTSGKTGAPLSHDGNPQEGQYGSRTLLGSLTRDRSHTCRVRQERAG